jgi:tRNA(Arg) A34 adenosine deaminase TadA
MRSLPRFHLRLPAWVAGALPPAAHVFIGAAERMDTVLDLAHRNVEARTGGPFAAAVFDLATGRLVAPGMNLVVPANCCVLHAEIVAIILAQQAIARHSFRSSTAAGYELVTSTEPCAMCLGAIQWSGVTSLVCGARDEDARRIGFDEGLKPDGWHEHFGSAGIAVLRDVRRAEACAVLARYHELGGPIYNG